MVTLTERKPLKYYLDLKYPVTIEAAPEGGYFVEIKDLPGCYSQGETVEEAMEMIEEARHLWLESAYEDGLDIPMPRDQDQYSGKFNVRVPKDLHRKLDRMAVREGVSLNQYIVSSLSQTVGRKEAEQKAKPAPARSPAKRRSVIAKQDVPLPSRERMKVRVKATRK